MQKRTEAYNQILKNINYLEHNLSKDNVLEESKLEQVWLNWYPYCSKDLNKEIHMFVKYFDKKTKIK